jgi:hypothetical protein
VLVRRRSPLALGSALRWALQFGPGYRTHTERELRRAWEEHREELLARQLGPGRRPWAWWRFEAGREEHLNPYPLDSEGTIEEHRDAIDEYEIEPIVFVASRGELFDDELEEIAAAAREVEPRIGTDAEHWGSGGVDYPDRRAVKLWKAVQREVGG